ncbi:hypothetical protein HZA33_05190 [Candidatus Pacearchaeota archaeon]|nr:hypothetical protein [Candidatus Pacearchaeota archaeon]
MKAKDIVLESGKTWREIVRLATPLDSDKEINYGSNPKSKTDFDAYTDNKRIFININNEAKLKKNFEDTIVPAYKIASQKLYRVKNKISDSELLKNIIYDTFLFVHFHEQLHPWFCPNSRFDERKITKTLYDGIKEAEPSLSKAQAMFKANNIKNLCWDAILNIAFISKTSGYNNETLEQKISFIFQDNGREIESQPVMHYPSGILPIVYMNSAANRTTDVPISLVGLLYSTMSFNSEEARKNAAQIFLDDLNSKKLSNLAALDVLKEMYSGFISDVKDEHLKMLGIDRKEYLKKISDITDFSNLKYEGIQKYFVASLTRVFDSQLSRYDSIKGFVKAISKYISVREKQGSFDSNTSSFGSGSGQGSGESGEGQAGGQGEEEGEESEEGEEDEGQGAGKGKSDEEMEGDSMSQTMDDLLEELPDKERDDLLEDVIQQGTNYDDYDSYGGGGKGAGMPSKRVLNSIASIATDEYYKQNADLIELKNPSEENISFELGTKKVWKLRSSLNLTSTEINKLNVKKIMDFQQKTGLPVLVDIGNGYWRFNDYELKETPLKSYSSQLTGIEIPDNWVLLQDSSGTMTGGFFVGTGNKFDILNRVKYGLMKGLVNTAKKLGKHPKFGIVDFSDMTRYSGLDDLVSIYDAKRHRVKDVSLSPQCGGTYLNSDVFKKIEKDLKQGKTIYTLITDGEVAGDNRIYSSIQNIASKKDTAFVFVEVASSSSLGQQVKVLAAKNPAVIYYKVSSIKSIKDKLGSILVKYS